MQDNVKALYTDRRFEELISKQQPEGLRDDLKHFVIVELDKWVSGKGYAGDTFPIAAGIVRNQLHSDKSKFYRQYRRAQTAGRTINTMPTNTRERQEAIVNTILEGKAVYDTFHHRAVTGPMTGLRMTADYWHGRQTGMYGRTAVISCVPVVLYMDAKDTDDVQDCLAEVQKFTNKLLGEMASPTCCIVEVGEPQIVEVKFN